MYAVLYLSFFVVIVDSAVYLNMGCQDFFFCLFCFVSIYSVTQCYRLTVLLLLHLVLFYQRADVLY